ncbi:hypothetical protein C8R43DRAFT_1120819 [Mycena crocata]|nr:hypothetical protein C8R43DRAFT_1120819 [Mycena crocata]
MAETASSFALCPSPSSSDSSPGAGALGGQYLLLVLPVCICLPLHVLTSPNSVRLYMRAPVLRPGVPLQSPPAKIL